MNGGRWLGLKKQIGAHRQRDTHGSEKDQPAVERRMRQGCRLGIIAIDDRFSLIARD